MALAIWSCWARAEGLAEDAAVEGTAEAAARGGMGSPFESERRKRWREALPWGPCESIKAREIGLAVHKAGENGNGMIDDS
jgi:hypothetical protein